MKLRSTLLFAAASFTASALAPVAFPPVAYGAGEIISLNFGKTENNVSDSLTGTAGLATYDKDGVATGVDATGWTNATGKTGSSSTLKNYDGETISGVSVSWNAPQDPWGPGGHATETVLGMVQSSYLDLSAGNAWTVSLDSSFLVCDVYVYLSGDGGKYAPVNINGVSYVGGENTTGSTEWGDRSTDASKIIVLGTNAIKVTDHGGVLTLSNVIMGDSGKRATLSGIQVVNTYAGTATEANLDGTETAWTNDAIGSTAWTNSTAEAGTYAAFNLTEKTTVNVSGEGIKTDAITASGSGVLTLSGNAITLIGPGVVRTDSDTASIVVDSDLTFSNGGTISGNVSFGEKTSINVSGGVLAMSASTVGGIISVSKDASLQIGSPVAENETVNDLTAVVGTGTIAFVSRGSTSDTGNSDPSFSRIQLSEDFTGTLSLVSGVLDLLEGDGVSAIKESCLGGARTLELNGGGILFRNNNGGSFTKDIVVGKNGGVIRLYGSGNMSVVGDISGIGTLTHTDGGTLTFKGAVENNDFRQVRGTTDFSGNTKLETITFVSGTIKFSNGGGHSVKSIETNQGNNRVLTIASGTTVSAQTLNNGWGLETLTVDGVLLIDGNMKYTTGKTESIVSGEGEIFAQGLILGNAGTYNISGVTLNIGSGGITSANEWGHKTNFGALTIRPTSDFSVSVFNNGTLGLSNADDGTTFDTDGYNVSIKQALSGEGKLVKTGAGTLTLSAENTYSGGTTIQGGTLVAANASSLGSGDVIVEGGKLLREVENTLTVGGNLTVSAGAILDLGELSAEKSAISVGGNVSLTEGVIFNIASQTAGTLLSSTGALSGITAEQVKAALYIDGVLVNQRAASATILENKIAVTFSEASVLDLTWNGGEDGVWKSNGSGWKNGDTDETFQSGDSVTFNNTAKMEVEGTVASGAVTVNGNSTLTLNSGTVLVSGAFTLTSGSSLAGTAKIDLGSTGTLSGTLSDKWMGTVKISNRNLHEESTGGFVFGNYGNESSWVEVSGISGYINDAWNSTEKTFAVSTNIIFTDAEDGSPAFKQTNNNSDSTIYFTGNISGSGTYENAISSPANSVTYAFSGDISGWTGAFKQTVNKTTTLKFTGDATDVNIDILGESGVLNIEFDGDGKTLVLSSEKVSLVNGALKVSAGTLDFVIPENKTWIYRGGNSSITGEGLFKISGGGVFSWNVDRDCEISADLEISEETTLTESVSYKFHRTISGDLFGGGTIYSAVPTSSNQGDGFKKMAFTGNTANFTGEWILETAAADSNTPGNRRILGILNSADGVFGGVINFKSKESSRPDSSKISSYLSLSKDMTIGGLKGTLGTVKGAALDDNSGMDAENGAHSLTINLANNANYDFGGTLASTITELTITGNGTQILSGVNSHGKTTVSGGILKATQSAALSTGEIVINETGTLELAFGGTFNRAVSGTGTIAKSGAEELAYSGAFSGSFNAKSGILSVDVENGSYKDLSIASGATFKAKKDLVFETVSNATGTLSGETENTRVSVASGAFAGTLSNVSLVKTGTGELDFSGAKFAKGASVVIEDGKVSNLKLADSGTLYLSATEASDITLSNLTISDAGTIRIGQLWDTEVQATIADSFVVESGVELTLFIDQLTLGSNQAVFTFSSAGKSAWETAFGTLTTDGKFTGGTGTLTLAGLGTYESGVFSWDGDTLYFKENRESKDFVWTKTDYYGKWSGENWNDPKETFQSGMNAIFNESSVSTEFAQQGYEKGAYAIVDEDVFAAEITINAGADACVSISEEGGKLSAAKGISVESGALYFYAASSDFYTGEFKVAKAGTVILAQPTLTGVEPLNLRASFSGTGTIQYGIENSKITLSGDRSQFTGTLDVNAGTVVLANGKGTENFSSIDIAEGATVAANGGAAVDGFSTLSLGQVSGTGTLSVSAPQGAKFFALDLSGSGFTGAVELNAVDMVFAKNPSEAMVTSVSNLAKASSVRLTNGASLNFFNEASTFDKNIEVAETNGAIRVYGDNTGTTLSGNISGAGTLTVKDGGKLILSGAVGTADSALGGLTLSAGSLEISGEHSSINVSGDVSLTGSSATINTNGTIDGKLTVNGAQSTLTLGGDLALGDFERVEIQDGDGRSMSVLDGANISVAGTAEFGNNESLNIGKNASFSAQTITNTWGLSVTLGEGSVLKADTLTLDIPGYERSGSFVGTSATTTNVEFGTINLESSASRLNFENITVKIGADGIAGAGDQKFIQFKDATVSVLGEATGWASDANVKLNGGATTFDVGEGQEITLNGTITEAVETATGTEGEEGYVAATSSALIKNGAGTLTLGKANANKGGTTLNAGTLKFTNKDGVTLSGSYTFAGGMLAAGEDTTLTLGAGTELSKAVVYTNDKNGKLLVSEDLSITGEGDSLTLHEKANVEIASGKTLSLDALNFTGNGSKIGGEGTLSLAGTVTVDNNRTNTITSGLALSEDTVLAISKGTLEIESEDISTGGKTLTKTGAGTLTLDTDAVYDFDGSFSLQGGTVNVGSRELTISDTHSFELANGVTLEGDLVLEKGSSATLGAGKITSDVTLSGATLAFSGTASVGPDRKTAMIQTLRRFCTPKERETVDTLLNIMCVMENYDSFTN